jgi:hypothetical protein
MLKRPELVLGFLAASLFWIAVLGWATSYSPGANYTVAQMEELQNQP